jgi:subtilisin family serine protease
VRSIKPEGYFRAFSFPSSDAGATIGWALNATRVSQSSASGKGIRVAILDTGIAMAHPAFAGRIGPTETFISGLPVEDGFGHGTHIAGIACGALPTTGTPRYGIAHRAEILVARVLSDSGLGRHSAVLDAIAWAHTNKADVIVMAFGGTVELGQKHLYEIEAAARKAYDGGSLLIAETGNDPSKSKMFPVNSPANCPSIMAIGSVDSNEKPSWFSCGKRNLDGEVNVAAPGEIILSAWPPDTTRALDGTSQAAAIAGGVAALWAETSSLRGAALWRKLETSVRKIGGSANEVGYGLVQAP